MHFRSRGIEFVEGSLSENGVGRTGELRMAEISGAVPPLRMRRMIACRCLLHTNPDQFFPAPLSYRSGGSFGSAEAGLFPSAKGRCDVALAVIVDRYDSGVDSSGEAHRDLDVAAPH